MGSKVVVVGAGAIGGYAGGHMARAGEDVTLIDMWPENVEYIRKHGIQISGLTPEETCSVPVNIMHISDVQGLSKQRPVDIAFIAVKSYDTEWATRMIQPYLSEHGICVSLQNCVNEPTIASVVGWGSTLGVAISLMGGELYKPGHIKRTVALFGEEYTVYRVGEVHGRDTPRAQEVARLLRSSDSAKVTSNLWGERWSKHVINSMRNGLSACTGMGGNERDLNPLTLWVGIRLGAEAVRVGQALGYRLEDMAHMEPEVLAAAGAGDAAARKTIGEILTKGASKRGDEQRPSMAQDIAKGRRTETDYINGFVAARGAEIGVPAPINAKINELVKQVERGERKASIENVRDI